MTPDEPVEGPRCEPRCGLCPRYCRNPPPASVPVESREQPSGWVCDEPNHLPIGWFRDRIEEQTQLAIRFNLDRGFGAVERDRLTAERDRARDLAAHLEEDSARQDTGKEGDALKPPDA